MKTKKSETNEKSKGQRSVIKWPGGKSGMVNKLVEMIPDHVGYTETFAGGLWKFFKKPRSKSEAVNDINGGLINFYNVVQEKPYQLIMELFWDLYSRQLFIKYKAKLESGEEMTDVEKAKIFYYVLMSSFAGQMGTFGYSRTGKPAFSIEKIAESIMSAHERLRGVYIESLDWRKFIPKYDSPDTYHYFDPPYRGKTSGRVYVKGFTDGDYTDFKELLTGLKGTFNLSLNDDEFIRELFKDFTIDEIGTNYSMNSKTVKPVTELIIRNY
ncbi:MAG: DNA adenine methylase [bacterium]|nr:DNA adenine methylase [bacterium]